MKTRATQLAVLAIAAVGLSACAGPRAFTRGTYEDPEQIAMLDDRWNQNDMQLVAKKIIESLQAWKQRDALDKPVVVLETPRNRTTEHIDLQALYDHVKTALINSGQFTFLDKAAQEFTFDYPASSLQSRCSLQVLHRQDTMLANRWHLERSHFECEWE